MRDRPRLLALTALVLAMLLAGALPATALDVRIGERERLLGELEQQRVSVRLDDGEVARGRALRFREDDRALALRPRLAREGASGVEGFSRMAQREVGRGAVAGINGGYWIDLREGNPNGLHVQDGRLTTTNASSGGGGFRPRSAMGITRAGRLLLDQVATRMTLRLPDASTVDVRYMNRRVHAAGDVVAYDDQFGDSVHVPPGGLLVVVEGMTLRPGGTTRGTVSRVLAPDRDRYVTLRSGQTAIVGHRSADIGSADELRNGQTVSLSVRVAPTRGGSAWPDDLAGALAGAGTLLREGQVPPLSEWTSEGFGRRHFTRQEPRTAIGRTPGGETLLVTVDGEQEGWSVGLTARELAEVMAALGARNAVNLDGGGSSAMAIGGQVANRPSDPGRAIANGLFVHTEPPPPARRIDQHACPADRVPTGIFRDVAASSVHAPAIDCLAWWGLTRGRDDGGYDPSGHVTRAQMATFLARWLDQAAEQGDSRPPPTDASLHFDDVDPHDTHAPAIARLARAGIIEGHSGTVYRPTAPVTRDQVASFLRRAMAYARGQQLPGYRDTFIDDNGSVHETAINRLARLGVASGVGGFEYQARTAVRRDAVSSLLMRAADHLAETGRTRPPA